MSYNASYHRELHGSPYFKTFGREPVLPGFQDYVRDETDEMRHDRLMQMLSSVIKDNLPEEVKDKNVEIDVEHDFKPGDVILYYRGSYERAIGDSGFGGVIDGLHKYQPKWSLPARVIGNKGNQLRCVEIGTNRVRDAPMAQCKLVPPMVPPTLQKINLEHIEQNLTKKSNRSMELNSKELAELRQRLGLQYDCDTKSVQQL